MDFRTPIKIEQAPFRIEPGQHILCVGSCFASNIGKRFEDALFPTTVNPYGVMYNPASILHTIERLTPHIPPLERPAEVAILTLGTNHVYVLKETGEIVDNCQKRPAALFEERELSVETCADHLEKAVALLWQRNPQTNIILTVSPIRYQKYGFHGSQLSKATLLLAVDRLLTSHASLRGNEGALAYFPAYEIMNDELRDYRFYAPDMLHPSEQAVDYIWQQFADTFFSAAAKQYLCEWEPIRQALAHHPFDEQSAAYQAFRSQTLQRLDDFKKKYRLKNGKSV